MHNAQCTIWRLALYGIVLAFGLILSGCDLGHNENPDNNKIPPNINIPNIDDPNIDIPNIDTPNIDIPNTDIPNTDIPNTDIPNTDIPNTDNSNTRIARIGIVGAKGLYIAKRESTALRAASDEESSEVLYKITEDGEIEEVEIELESDDPDSNTSDDSNTVVETPVPDNIIDVNEDYLIMQFGETYYEQFLGESYLIRKTDGAAFLMDSNPAVKAVWDYLNASPIQTDGSGNIYYLDSSEQLIKLDISNPENITSVPYAASNRDRVRAFQITPDGHIAYSYIGTMTTDGARIRSSFGGIKNLPRMDTLYWIGLDGKIYYLDGQDYDNSYIYRVEIDNSGFIATRFANASERGEDGFQLRQLLMVSWMSYKLNLPDRIIIACTNGYVVEVDNPEHEPVGQAAYNSITGAGASDRNYYLAALDKSGDPSIYKIDPASNTARALLPVGDYEVYSLSVGKDDYVYFHAMKMANGWDVVGEIDSAGTLTIVSESVDSREIKSLIRLY